MTDREIREQERLFRPGWWCLASRGGSGIHLYRFERSAVCVRSPGHMTSGLMRLLMTLLMPESPTAHQLRPRTEMSALHGPCGLWLRSRNGELERDALPNDKDG